MTPEQLKKRLQDSGFPEWKELFKISQKDDKYFRMIAGMVVINGHELPPDLQKWVADGNIGKVCALGQFLVFIRSHSNDEVINKYWSDFLQSDAECKRSTLHEALDSYRNNAAAILTSDGMNEQENFYDAMLERSGTIIEKLRNPKYLIYRSSRQLVSMLKRDGVHAECYYLERTLTSHFFKGIEKVIW